jgi:hypothetical protein
VLASVAPQEIDGVGLRVGVQTNGVIITSLNRRVELRGPFFLGDSDAVSRSESMARLIGSGSMGQATMISAMRFATWPGLGAVGMH